MNNNKEALLKLKPKSKEIMKRKTSTKRDRKIVVYVNEDELNQIKERAESKGFKSLSAFMLQNILYAD
jgi:uncharacterized protein (DUF1778 family)